MKHISRILPLICIFSLSCSYKKSVSEGSQEPKPNLLIVISDQHSYDMLGAYGNEQVLTPNLDQFATEGMLFRNAYSNQPVCTPYRGMLLSGMHPLKNGTFINDVPLQPNPNLLGNILKAQGYQTAYIGKWHLLGGDRDRPIPKGELRYGFDTVLTNNCHVDFRPGKAFFWNDKGEKEYFQEWEVYGQTKQALEYLDGIDKEKPFALVVSWHPPHDWGLFRGLDGNMHFRYETLPELMKLYNRDSIKVRPGLTSTPDRRRMYHGHMAMITGIDKAFGQLMDKIKEMGVEDNTLTVFSADHGDMLESHGAVKPKQYIHEYSSHIPLIMKYPKKIEPGTSGDQLIGALDMMPTLLGLMDIESNQDFDGDDLSNVIANNEESPKEYIPMWVYTRYMQQSTSWRGVITEDYAFSMNRSADSTSIDNALFDRKKDPHQLNNLYYNEDFKAERERLEAVTYSWMEKYNDDFYDLADILEAKSLDFWKANYNIPPGEVLAEAGKDLTKQ